MGEGKAQKKFATDYLERRSRWKNSLKGGARYEDDLTVPASALSPGDGEFQVRFLLLLVNILIICLSLANTRNTCLSLVSFRRLGRRARARSLRSKLRASKTSATYSASASRARASTGASWTCPSENRSCQQCTPVHSKPVLQSETVNQKLWVSSFIQARVFYEKFGCYRTCTVPALYILFYPFLPILAVITKKQETTTSDMKMNTTEAKVYRNIHFLNCLKKTFWLRQDISLSQLRDY